MNTTNDGSPSVSQVPPRRGLPLGLGLVGAGVALLVAILFGPRLVGLLFAIASPPMPPLPEAVTALSHEELAYGVDRWTYSTEGNICELVTFYESHEGQCPVLPPSCQAETPIVNPDLLARCHGDVEFAAFLMRWRLEIPHRGGHTSTLRFELSRQISWTGTLPPEAP